MLRKWRLNMPQNEDSQKQTDALEVAIAALKAEFSIDEDCGEYGATAIWGTPEEVARKVLEAVAASTEVSTTEWGIFRANDPADAVTPIENMKFKTEKAAEKWITFGLIQPELWEVRHRTVGRWIK
jgi:hypothetical protein